MKLKLETARAIREALQAKGNNLQVIAGNYQERGLSFERFIWDAYHSIGHKVTVDIIQRTNPDVKVVGGYLSDVKDSHIETMLKVALKDYKF